MHVVKTKSKQKGRLDASFLPNSDPKGLKSFLEAVFICLSVFYSPEEISNTFSGMWVCSYSFGTQMTIAFIRCSAHSY